MTVYRQPIASSIKEEKKIPQFHIPTKSTLRDIDNKFIGTWQYQFSFATEPINNSIGDSIFLSTQSPKCPRQLIFFYEKDSSNYFNKYSTSCSPKISFVDSLSNLLVAQDKKILVPMLFAHSKATSDSVHLQLTTYCGYQKNIMNVVRTLNGDTLLLSTTYEVMYYLRKKTGTK